MARENKKIDQVQYQELIESFKKLEDERFPVKLDHSYGKGIIDSVRATGHNREKVHLFKELATDAVTLFEIPCAGYEVERWIRLVFEYVPKLAKHDPSLGGGLMFFKDIHNAAEASVIAMRRLYAREANKEDISDESNRKRRPNRDEEQVEFDDLQIYTYLLKNQCAKRDEVSKATGIATGTVSKSKAWKEHSKQKKEIKKANTAKNVKDIESFPS